MDNKQPKLISGISGLVAALIVAVPILLTIAIVVWLVRLIVLGVSI